MKKHPIGKYTPYIPFSKEEMEEIALWSVKWSKFLKNSPYYDDFYKNYDLIRCYETSQLLFYMENEVPPRYMGHIRIMEDSK